MKINLNALLKYLPLLAPLPEGYAVGLAIYRELNWHISIVVIAAIVVAGTGFWGVQVYNKMSEFNATNTRDEKKDREFIAPTWKAIIVLAIWFIGVAALTVLLDIYPLLRALTPLGLVVIGFSAAYLFSLSNIQGEREQARAMYRIDKLNAKQSARNLKDQERKDKKERAQALATLRQQVSKRLNTPQYVQGGEGTLGTTQIAAPRARSRSKSGSKLSAEILLVNWAINPYLTDTEMVTALWEDGRGIEVSRQAVGQRRKHMIAAGIIRQDPDGRVVELIGSADPEGPVVGTGGAG